MLNQEQEINYMVEDNGQLSHIFLLYVNDNYNVIKRSFLRSKELRYTLSDDVYQEGILRCAERIHKVGLRIENHHMSGQTFKNYLFISLKNIVHKERDKESRIKQDENYINNSDFERLEIDNVEDNLDNEFNRMYEDMLIDDIFKFIEGRYKPIYVGFFKFYFKTEYSYREIAKLTGYGVVTVFSHIQTIKADVKLHFADRRLPHRILKNDDIK